MTGYFYDSSGYARGFIKDGDNFEVIEHEKADSAACAYDLPCGTFLTGINNSGHVVGVFTDTGGYYRGFLKDGDGYAAIDYSPNNAINTWVGGINDSGRTVGCFYGSDGYARGFIKTGNNFEIIEHPDAARNGDGTYVLGINNSGQIVGWFDDGERSHGFSLSN